MAVKYSAHAEQKLSMRSISKEEVERLIVGLRQRYADIEHDAKVAVGPVNGRFLVVIYRTVDADIKVITVYHARELEKFISSETKRGAWRET